MGSFGMAAAGSFVALRGRFVGALDRKMGRDKSPGIAAGKKSYKSEVDQASNAVERDLAMTTRDLQALVKVYKKVSEKDEMKRCETVFDKADGLRRVYSGVY